MRKKIIGYDIINYNNILNSIVENDINFKVNEISSLLDNLKWSGVAYKSFEQRYNSVIFEIKKIPKILNLYNKILSQIMDNYEDMIYELKKGFDELEDDLSQKGDIDG